MSLYRIYRPSSFADVVGQDHVVSTLEQAVTQGKLSHAYLFAGSRGTGKTSVARILAKILMIQGCADEERQRLILRAADDGSLIDIVEIDAASNTGVEDMRGLLEQIQFSPVMAQAKVYIIDEAHMLSKAAFNALLKTLEEPPPYAYFIFATTELFKIPATIQSRCQRYLFRQIREEDIIRRLQFVADQEHITVERAALRTIAHHVQGSLRDAVSLLDQLRSLPAITVQDVLLRTGESGQEYVEQMLAAMNRHDAPAVLQMVRTMEEEAIPLESFARLLLTEIRMSLHEAIERKHDTTALLQMLNILLQTLRDMRIAPVPGLVLESSLLEICEVFSGTDKRKAPPALITKRDVSSTSSVVSVTAPMKEPVAEPAAPTAVEAPEFSMESVLGAWTQIVRDIPSPAVMMSAKNGRFVGIEGTTLVLSFNSAFHRDKVAATEAARSVEALFEAVFKKPVRLKCILEQDRENDTTGSSEVVNLADAAAEIF